ncbi:DNA ligase 3 [Golovinomyces cichoracearum]|uniref:DNA ligase n=1 Tax=Golovinomyces cichoracearum TaxID=62708 RepID=A0A420HV50_9PEZI|nr:DNA ligase 3 [Golovinomyces cichoracearum]
MAGKRRKLIRDPPRAGVGLDYFFGKQQKNLLPEISSHSNITDQLKHETEKTDEELARQLQAEWNREDTTIGAVSSAENSKQETVTLSSDIPDNSTQTPKESHCPVESFKDENFKTNESSGVKSQETLKNSTLALQASGLSNDTIASSIPFDQNPLLFNPSDYWKELQCNFAQEDASYALLTRCFTLINSTTSRIKIVDTLVNLLRLLIEGDPPSLLPSVWLATNAISPPYVPLELGLGGSAISKALKNVFHLDSKSLKSLYDKLGDAGDVAFEVKKRQTYTLKKPKPLTIKHVYHSLVKIATTQGVGSGELKQRVVDRLLQDTRGAEESRFIVRTLCQHLRIGAVKTTMLIALSRAFQLSRSPGAEYPLRSIKELSSLSKEALAEVWSKGEDIVKACFARRPNYNDLIPALLDNGINDELLVRCGLILHIPICPMLGSITRDLSEMLARFHDREFTCEYKYDGQRAQIHCDSEGKISIFSRHLELMTDKYPDLVALIPKIHDENVTSFIMEGEIVAVEPSTGNLKPFQTLSNRARKDVSIGSIKVEVCLFAFDLMYLNGNSLLHCSLRQRRELLRGLFIEIAHSFMWVKNLDANSLDSENILEFFNSALENKCEGIMVKMLDDPREKPNSHSFEASCDIESARFFDSSKTKSKEKNIEKKDRRKVLLSTYEPDKRLESWLKIKKDYSTSYDTLDLIPIAAWHGQGRKSKWWSPILLAVRNEDTGSLEAVCKCISGFTDNFYKESKEFYREDGPNVLSRKPAFIEYQGGNPDVWFEPKEVFEVAFADLTLSPVYTAAIGLVSEDRGLSIRFPRFLKKRDDKSIDEASTSDFLAALWRKQEDRSFSGGTRRIRDEEDAQEL